MWIRLLIFQFSLLEKKQWEIITFRHENNTFWWLYRLKYCNYYSCLNILLLGDYKIKNDRQHGRRGRICSELILLANWVVVLFFNLQYRYTNVNTDSVIGTISWHRLKKWSGITNRTCLAFPMGKILKISHEISFLLLKYSR